MRSAVAALLLLASVTACKPTPPTGHPACDGHPAVTAAWVGYNTRTDCAATINNCTWVGLHVPGDRIDVYTHCIDGGAPAIGSVLWHEVGHARWHAEGWTENRWRAVRNLPAAMSSYQVREDYAELHRWCNDNNEAWPVNGTPTRADCRRWMEG